MNMYNFKKKKTFAFKTLHSLTHMSKHTCILKILIIITRKVILDMEFLKRRASNAFSFSFSSSLFFLSRREQTMSLTYLVFNSHIIKEKKMTLCKPSWTKFEILNLKLNSEMTQI